MNLRQAWGLLKDAASAWVDDYAPSMGAALAYYSLFSIAPLLLIAISVAGLVFGEAAARGEIVAQLQDLTGEQVAQTLQQMLTALNEPTQGVISTVLGVVALLVGATTVFGELQASLDRIWHAPPERRRSGLRGLLLARFLSFGLILGVGFLLMVSLLVNAALAALGKWWAPMFGGLGFTVRILDFALSFGLITVIFAMIYKFMTSVRIEWRDVWIGAAMTSLLFALGKYAIGLYIGRSGVASGFGAAGSLVVLLVWLYYSAQIFLFGAELTGVYAYTYGSLKHRRKPRPERETADTAETDSPEEPKKPEKPDHRAD